MWRQKKFGIDEEVTKFGYYLANRMSDITRKIFEEPSPAMLGLFKTYTYKLGSKEAPFGFQYMPGGGSFEGYADIGADMGASFDGRKKGQAIGEDNSPQNYPLDIPIDDPRY